MSFTLLPAVDVSEGQAVQLTQAELGATTTHGDPLDAALAWQSGGAEWIHLVDIGAAFGRGSNASELSAIVDRLDVPVQLSGGITEQQSLERALSTGCARVNLGTAALEDHEWCARAIAEHGDRIAVALDVRRTTNPSGSVEHVLAARGESTVHGDLWETLQRLDREGCRRYVVTDVRRDGTLQGPNIELLEAVARATSAAVIASGGVASLGDLVVLAERAAVTPNLEGSIVGKALHARRFTLPEALASVGAVALPSDQGSGSDA